MRLKVKYKVIVINIVILVLIGVFCFSTYRYIQITRFNQENKKVNKEIIEKVVIPIETEKETSEKEEFTIDFKKLKGMNRDVIGWIYIPKTNINYPIVQKNDNKYYLNHDINKKYNILGSIFMNSSNHFDFSDANTILFGHNNHKDHLMFTDLSEVYNGALGEELDVYIYTEKDTLIYRIYSAYLADPNDGDPLNVKTAFFEKTETKFNYERSEVNQTLTLSTCYKDSNQRIIVHALRVM